MEINEKDAVDGLINVQKRINEAHDKADGLSNRRLINARVPGCLLDYADKYANRTGQTQEEIIKEALCLFYGVFNIGNLPEPKATRRRVRRIRRRRVRVHRLR